MRANIFRKLFLMFVGFLSFTGAIAQDASRIYVEKTGWSVGLNIGWTDLWGDVGTKSFIDHYVNSKYFDNFSGMLGVQGRYTIHPCLSVRGMLSAGTLFATDEWNYDKAQLVTTQLADAYQRYARNQRVRTYVGEFNTMMEFTPFRRNPESRKAHRRGQPYIAAGLGMFYFVPTAQVGLSDKYENISNLNIEGNGWGDGYPKKFSQFQVEIPMAIGYRWDLSSQFTLGVEYLFRKTFCDYLDGVSAKYVDPKLYYTHLSASEANLAVLIQDKGYLAYLAPRNKGGEMRGDPTNTDSYSSLLVTFYYKLKKRDKEWW